MENYIHYIKPKITKKDLPNLCRHDTKEYMGVEQQPNDESNPAFFLPKNSYNLFLSQQRRRALRLP